MIVKRFIAAAIVLGLGSSLGSCGGSQFSGYVADHWPHWAGGMPEDVPPRPGTPGYDAFIAHGQADQDTTKSPAAGPAVTFEKTAGAAKPKPAAAPQTAPSDGVPSQDSSVVKGGLY
jgi:hypothetical protein